MATDGMLPPRATSGGRTFVDELFAFSASLGTDYSGAWRDESTFAIRILDTANAGTPTMSGPCSLHNVSLAVFPEDYCIFNRLVLATPPPPLPPGSTGTPPPPPAHPTFAPAYTGWPPPVYVFFNASANLRSVAGRSQFTREPTALSGSFGTSLPPALISFVADDYDNLDPTFSPGDTLTATFDMLTNMGGEASTAARWARPATTTPPTRGGSATSTRCLTSPPRLVSTTRATGRTRARSSSRASTQRTPSRRASGSPPCACASATTT